MRGHGVQTDLLSGPSWGSRRVNRIGPIMVVRRCVLAVFVATLAVGAGTIQAQPTVEALTTTTGPTSMTIAERKVVHRLHRLDDEGKADEVLDITTATELTGHSYDFRHAVLMCQSEAQRRLGQFTSAVRSIRTLLEHAQQEPGYRRDELLPPLVFLVHLYRRVFGGFYKSPRRRSSAAIVLDEAPKPISDDDAWHAAKKDYAHYLLESVDLTVAKLPELSTPAKLKGALGEMLGSVQMVRSHDLVELANEKAAAAICATLVRYEEVVSDPCKKEMANAELLRRRKLWPRARLVTPKQKRAIAYEIHGNVRRLYVINYKWGKGLTAYSRKHDLLDSTKDDLAKLAERGKRLKESFVALDNYLDSAYEIHPIGEPPNDPLSKIPTDPW